MIAYTATRWGHLCDPAKMPAGLAPPPARDCYRFALTHPAVDMVLCGPKNREQMQEALRALDAGPLAPDELARLQRIGDHIYGRYRPQFAEQGDRVHAKPEN
jgi:predicted aldo/keto reductase-like oxidoreductase